MSVIYLNYIIILASNQTDSHGSIFIFFTKRLIIAGFHSQSTVHFVAYYSAVLMITSCDLLIARLSCVYTRANFDIPAIYQN